MKLGVTFRRGAAAALLAAVAACTSDAPTNGSPNTDAPELGAALSVSDGGNAGQVPGFIWLTPTVKSNPKSFTGTFDPDLTPNVAICPIASDASAGAAACTGAVIRTMSTSTQPEIIRVDLEKENYSVTWQSTSGNGIVAGGRYRALLSVGTRLLGWVDLQAVEKQQEVARVAAGYAGVVLGQPFVFKWRIETGIPGAIVVTPAAPTIKDNATQLFTAVVTDLHGDILPDVTVNWSIDNAAIAALSPTSGTTSAAGVSTSTATPVIGVGGTTTVRAGSQGIEGTAALTVVRAVGSVTLTPATKTIKDNETQTFTATVRDLINNPLPGATVNWTIDNGALASLSPTSGTSAANGQVTTLATASGPLGTTTVRATADGVQGTAALTIEASCSLASPDTDNDRLPDCYETNTRVFLGVTNTGTDPNNRDTDGDNIADGDEVRGTAAGLNLPGMGTNPLRRDLLLEYDWFDDALDPGQCASHSHRPTAAQITRFTAAMTAAPVNNPDGSTGINVINDYGQGGLFTGGALIADADGVIAEGVGDTDFSNYKAANFAANRDGYFHYVLLPHRYNTNSGSSGQAEIDGDDLIVSLQCYLSTENVANTIMHELGHNLNLRHGGDENLNYKPNYNSVMNYIYQFPGINNNCTRPGSGILSFSVGVRITLNEGNLDEREGLCGSGNGPGIDWNGDGDATDFGFSRNLNPDYDTDISILRDFNDWAAVKLSGIGDASGALVGFRMAKEIVSCEPVPLHAQKK